MGHFPTRGSCKSCTAPWAPFWRGGLGPSLGSFGQLDLCTSKAAPALTSVEVGALLSVIVPCACGLPYRFVDDYFATDRDEDAEHGMQCFARFAGYEMLGDSSHHACRDAGLCVL